MINNVKNVNVKRHVVRGLPGPVLGVFLATTTTVVVDVLDVVTKEPSRSHLGGSGSLDVLRRSIDVLDVPAAHAFDVLDVLLTTDGARRRRKAREQRALGGGAA